MRTGQSRNVFGSCLMRLESSGELTPLIPQSDSEPSAAKAGIERDAELQPYGNGEGERETELLEAIRRDAEDLSAECGASASRRPQLSRASVGLFPEISPDESDCELLDVDPMSIDEYMNRLHARTQRAGSRNQQWADARRAARPAFPVEPPPATEGARNSETLSPAESISTPPPNLAAEVAAEGKGGQSGRRPVLERPTARNTEDTRANRDNLREIVRETTRSTLVQHIRRRHQLVLARKLLLIFVPLGLAIFLYAAHFIYGVPLRHLAWGATAIGLVALLGMVQLWSRAARRQSRLQVQVSFASRKSIGAPGRLGKRAASVASRPSSG